MMDENAGTEASRQLLDLAREVARVYVAELRPRVVLVGGSAAEGISDHWSDLDLVVYHDQMPSQEAIADARRAAGGPEQPMVILPWDGESFVESYPLHGVECQVGHATVARMRREADEVLVELEVDSPYQKALDGLLHAIPLHGEDEFQRWRERLSDYPEPLRRAMVERHLRFFPLWMIDERMATRDAVLWRQQALVEAAFNLLAVLAGLNRLYFSTFQFKRMHAFVGRMTQAPPDLAGRIDRLFTQPERAAAELESLVGETVELVRRELPDIDVTAAARWLGVRPSPWLL